MSLVNDRSDTPSSFGVHRLSNVPLSAFEAGSLGHRSQSAPHRPGLPGSGDGVTSIFDMFTRNRTRLLIGAGASLVMILLIWLT